MCLLVFFLLLLASFASNSYLQGPLCCSFCLSQRHLLFLEPVVFHLKELIKIHL